jgi:hypothetical protein
VFLLWFGTWPGRLRAARPGLHGGLVPDIQADSLERQIHGHKMPPLPRPSASDSKLAAFDAVVAKGVAKKPAKRYQTAAELAAAACSALDVARTVGPVRARVGGGKGPARDQPSASKSSAVTSGRL